METWLRRRPRPAALRLTLQTGEVRMMPLDSVRSWQVIAESVSALDPDVVEAIDASGAILRVLSSDQMQRPAREQSHTPPPAPAPRATSVDPETRRFEVVAGIIADAYRHSTDVAFARMVDLFEAVNQRQASQEKSLENMHKLLRRALQDQLDDAAEAQTAQPKSDDMLGDLARSFVGGLAGGEHLNGKAKA